MERSKFATLLRNAILGVWEEFIADRAIDNPYAFALVGSQLSSYLNYTIATETGLQAVAAKYEAKDYRYRGGESEEFDNRQQLAIWLRWANPDDGWVFGDFPEKFQIQAELTRFVEANGFDENEEDFEEFCIEVLASLSQEPTWKLWRDRVVVGFTYGEDRRDFLRTATRANSYRLVNKLWEEHCQGEEFSWRISSPKYQPPNHL